MNVTELARRIKVSPNEMRDLFPRLGFDIGRKAIKVDDAAAHKIIEMVEGDANIVKDYRKEKLPEEVDEEVVATDDQKKITIPAVITVRDFATMIEKPVASVIQELMKNGILANLNEQIDFETATIIAQDFGFVTVAEDNQEQATTDDDTIEKILSSDNTDQQARPPIVVVMGHVDHGKTQLLDSIRKTNVVAKESGGITQHIGAYQAIKNKRQLTFIDTPGHEAFTTMRSRGARVADLGILVIAGDDGIKPQTEEAIKIIQNAELPFVVAINKMDKPESDLKKVQNELAQKNLLPEDWGGTVITVPVSAKTGEGVDTLLDSLLVVADVEKDNIQANPKRPAVGTVIESHVDKGEGAVSTVIVQTGTLRQGDTVHVGNVVGKIRAMKDFKGADVTEAPPSMPVKLLGLKETPEVGDILQVSEEDISLKKIKKSIQHKRKVYSDKQTWKKTQAKDEDEEEEEDPTVHIILKADVVGSLEAIMQSMETITQKDVSVEIVKKGLGNITDVDVLQAESTGARIYGFNVKISPRAEELAKEKEIPVLTDSIIYNLIDDVTEQVGKLVTYDKVRVDVGRAKVLEIFRTEKKSMIIGGMVTKGKLLKNERADVIRNDEKVGSVTIIGLQQGKEDVNEVPSGTECGLSIKGMASLEKGDFLEVYTEELKK